MIFVLDNYDSFTYNLVHLLYQLGADVQTARNWEITVEEILERAPNGIILSPGPGRPSNAGIMPELLKAISGTIPILGVCLGHEAIGEAFGAKLVHSARVMHGKRSAIHHDGKGLFQNIPKNFEAVRYHSLALDRNHFPDSLEITAVSDDGEIMGIRHRTFLIEGVQYHPESIMTEFGKEQMANFLNMISVKKKFQQTKHD